MQEYGLMMELALLGPKDDAKIESALRDLIVEYAEQNDWEKIVSKKEPDGRSYNEYRGLLGLWILANESIRRPSSNDHVTNAIDLHGKLLTARSENPRQNTEGENQAWAWTLSEMTRYVHGLFADGDTTQDMACLWNKFLLACDSKKVLPSRDFERGLEFVKPDKAYWLLQDMREREGYRAKKVARYLWGKITLGEYASIKYLADWAAILWPITTLPSWPRLGAEQDGIVFPTEQDILRAAITATEEIQNFVSDIARLVTECNKMRWPQFKMKGINYDLRGHSLTKMSFLAYTGSSDLFNLPKENAISIIRSEANTLLEELGRLLQFELPGIGLSGGQVFVEFIVRFDEQPIMPARQNENLNAIHDFTVNLAIHKQLADKTPPDDAS